MFSMSMIASSTTTPTDITKPARIITLIGARRESKRKRISTTKTNSEPNCSALVSVERVAHGNFSTTQLDCGSIEPLPAAEETTLGATGLVRHSRGDDCGGPGQRGRSFKHCDWRRDGGVQAGEPARGGEPRRW